MVVVWSMQEGVLRATAQSKVRVTVLHWNTSTRRLIPVGVLGGKGGGREAERREG